MSYPNNYLPPTPVIPGNLLIESITNAYPCAVTFIDSIENSYIVGQCVYMIVPASYGMKQINGQIGTIISISDNIFYLDIDTTYYDLFVVPSGNVVKPASMSPAGSRNLVFNNQCTRVPFQSLYPNRGN